MHQLIILLKSHDHRYTVPA